MARSTPSAACALRGGWGRRARPERGRGAAAIDRLPLWLPLVIPGLLALAHPPVQQHPTHLRSLHRLDATRSLVLASRPPLARLAGRMYFPYVRLRSISGSPPRWFVRSRRTLVTYPAAPAAAAAAATAAGAAAAARTASCKSLAICSPLAPHVTN